MSLSFFTFMFGFFSAVSIYSKCLKENGYESLGFYGLATLYFVFSPANFIAPSLATLLSPIRALQLSGFTFSIWIFSGYLSTVPGLSPGLVTFAVIGASALEGFGASVLWVAQGKYMSDCIAICPDKAGQYASMFWTITLGSQIFAYFFNSLILGYSTQSVLFLCAMCINILGLVMFTFLPKP